LVLAWWLGSPLFINNRVNESFPIAEQQAAQDAAPIALASGSFRDGDSFHKGSGKAGIYQVADGSYVLRFEDFEVTNGPDLHVYLAKHANPTTTSEVNEGGYLDLGSIKGNQGAQNYAIPAGSDLSLYKSVVIYCQPFHVVFSVAPLATS
jgi:Electron transfer DM13